MVSKHSIEILINATDKASKTLDVTSKRLDHLGDQAGKISRRLLAVSGAIAGAVLGMSKELISYGDNWVKLSRMTGVATNELIAFDFAARRWGATSSAAQMAIKTLSKAMFDASEGLETYKRLFDAMNISVFNSQGHLKTFSEILPEISDWFAQTTDETTKTAIAVQLFGRSGMLLRPLLDQGAEGFELMRNRAEELGLFLDKDLSDQTERGADAILDMTLAAKTLRMEFVDDVLPALNDTIETITSYLIQAREWVDEHPQMAASALKLAGVLAGAGGLLAAVWAITKALQGARTAIISVRAVLAFPLAYPGIAAAALAIGGISIVVHELNQRLKDAKRGMQAMAEEADKLKRWEEASTAAEQAIAAIEKEIERIKKLLPGEKIRVGMLEFESKEEAIKALKERILEINKDISKLTVDKVKLPITVAPGPVGLPGSLRELDEELKRIQDLYEDEEIKIGGITFESREEAINALKAKINEIMNELGVPIKLEPPNDEELRIVAKLTRDKLELEISQEPIEMPPLRILSESEERLVFKGEEIADRAITRPFAAAFAHTIGHANEFSKNMESAFDMMADAVKAIIAELMARMLTFLLLKAALAPFGGYAGLTFGSFVLGLPKAQAGGKITAGLETVDALPVLTRKGETILDRELTQRLETFIESSEESDMKQAPQVYNFNIGLYNGTEQDSIRLAQEIARLRSDYLGDLVAIGSA